MRGRAAILPGMSSTPYPTLVDDDRTLEALLDRLSGAHWITVDTEFVRERTYFGQLCLVQLGDAATAACVDALRVDLAPLWRFLAERHSDKVLHSASQDLELFVRHTDACPLPLFDTQVAAAMIGLGDQVSYAALVEARLGAVIDKSQSRTDWSARPLSTAQLDYAADDVRHLATLYPALRDAVEARGRMAWLQEDCARLADPSRYRPDPALAWQRLKGLGRLDTDAQHAAAALAEWRERKAIDRDRPRRWILPDEAILRLAERKPDHAEAVHNCPEVPSRTALRHAREWIDLLTKVRGGNEALVVDFRPDAAHRALVKRLSTVTRERAEALDVPPSLLAPRAALEQLARFGVTDDNLALQGWRRDVIGPALVDALTASPAG